MFLVKSMLIVGLFPIYLWASSGEEAPAAAEKVNQDYSGKQTQEWADVQKRLGELKAKLEAQDVLVKNLIVQKAHAVSDEQIKKSEELQMEHRKLQKITAEYNQLSSDYETKFPEKGIKENRIYNRVSPKSIEGLEKELTLEGRLNKLHGEVIRQYNRAPQKKSPQPKTGTHKKAPTPKAAPGPADQDVTEKIILQK